MKLENICENSCSSNGECDQVLGCRCDPGFIEHDCSIQIKCFKDCNHNGVCHNNGRCGCYPGWVGNLCEMKIPCKNNCTSEINGHCQHDKECKCNKGYSGEDCSITKANKNKFQSLLQMNEIDERIKQTKCKNNCSGNGECNNYTKICNCKDQYIGDDCSIDIFKSINLNKFKMEFIEQSNYLISNSNIDINHTNVTSVSQSNNNKLKNTNTYSNLDKLDNINMTNSMNRSKNKIIN